MLAKEATGWKVVYKNNKRREINTRNTTPVPPTFHHLRVAIKAKLGRLLLGEWEEWWKDRNMGHTLFRHASLPSKKTLALHQNLP